ncbi:MAG: hypothetical protein JWM12_269 [Ilumatobacteraceae bacterium]|nr:hypothetical protein [Ilumatobacteraceae bacterium]
MSTLPHLRRVLLLASGLAVLASCGSVGASDPGKLPAPGPGSGTVGGVGILPSTVDPQTEPASTAGSTTSWAASAAASAIDGSTTVVATSSTEPGIDDVGKHAAGNRVLLIGDSVLASTSRRYSNDMCNALVPMGWQVELDAEVGRFIDFGKQVLDKRLAAGWDVGVIFLGSNYGNNPDVYSALLEQQVDRLSPNPVVLVTVTEFAPTRVDVNNAIRAIAAARTNVTVLDWATISKAAPGLLGGDGLHLTTSGRTSLALSMAATLGAAPLAEPGDCLTTSYHNDSAGSVDTGTTAPVRVPRVTTPKTTKPTTKPVTTTTAAAGGGAVTTTTAKPATGTTAAPVQTVPVQSVPVQSTSPPVQTTARPTAPTQTSPVTASPTTASPTNASPTTAAGSPTP